MKENRGYTVRIGDLAEALEKRAKKNKVKRSAIIRRALRAYLEDKSFVELDTLISELAALRLDLSRVGINLNQIARFFNTHNTIDNQELGCAHADLRKEFQEQITFLNKINKEVLRQSK